MRKALLTLCLMAFALHGCASHDPIQDPSLDTDLKVQSGKKTVNDVSIMIRVVHDKEMLQAYYDEDLVGWGMLPVQVNIENLGKEPAYLGLEYAALICPTGRIQSALSFEQAYHKAKKSYWATAGWAVAFGLVGAVPSLINVSQTNEKIAADYKRVMLKSGEMVENAHTEGSIFFDIDKKIASLDGWKFKIGFERETKPFMVTFDLEGKVEQPRFEGDTSTQSAYVPASAVPVTLKPYPPDRPTVTFAILPMSVGYTASNYKISDQGLADALVEAIDEGSGIDVTHSFYKNIHTSDSSINYLSSSEVKGVWKRVSAFSDPEPDMERIVVLGKRYGFDYGYCASVKDGPIGKDVRIYMVDVKRGEMSRSVYSGTYHTAKARISQTCRVQFIELGLVSN